MTGPQVEVPEWCESVGPQCPVEGTVYGYYPSLPWNGFFAAAFALAFILQVGLGIRYKTWTYMIGVGLGCLGETIGYIGRIQMHNNPYDNNGFTIQIVMLIFSPAFLAAGIYLTLKHIVINFGEQWSRLRPNWYTYIFIACDITSLILQSAGGALAATADSSDQKALDAGTDIMIGGIIFQVIGTSTSSPSLPSHTNDAQSSPSSPPSSWNTPSAPTAAATNSRPRPSPSGAQPSSASSPAPSSSHTSASSSDASTASPS